MNDILDLLDDTKPPRRIGGGAQAAQQEEEKKEDDFTFWLTALKNNAIYQLSKPFVRIQLFRPTFAKILKFQILSK